MPGSIEGGIFFFPHRVWQVFRVRFGVGVFGFGQRRSVHHDAIYSKRMPTQDTKSASQAQAQQQGFVYLPLIAGWLVPGAGHFLLRKWGRGALLAASILGMFVLGLAMQGKLYTSAHEVLEFLGLIGDLGNGLLYIISRAMSLGADSVQVTTADWGTRFIVVAGLLNVIAAVDAHNLRTGRKSL